MLIKISFCRRDILIVVWEHSLTDSPNPASRADSLVIFTMGISITQTRRSSGLQKKALNTACAVHSITIHVTASAQLPLHAPVNGLHSIEIAALTNWFFLLT